MVFPVFPDANLIIEEGEFEEFTIDLFLNPVRGVKAFHDINYRQVPVPTNIPANEILHIQEFFKTAEVNNSSSFVIPLFLNLPAQPTSPFDQYYTVAEFEIRRIDLISYKFYGTPELWWIILLANNIIDPFGLTPGIILRIPSIDTVYAQWLNPLPTQFDFTGPP